MERGERGPERLRYSEHDFKVCDFCGALNPVANADCFVCGWNGRFHNDRETVRDAMNNLEMEFGIIDSALFSEEIVPSSFPRQSMWAEVWKTIKGFFHRV